MGTLNGYPAEVTLPVPEPANRPEQVGDEKSPHERQELPERPDLTAHSFTNTRGHLIALHACVADSPCHAY